MIVALPMYDRPEVAAVHDRLCQLFVEAYGDGPQKRTDPKDLWALWQNPELLLAQTCGYPLRIYLKGKVALIGAPDHGISEVPAGHYCSVIVTRTSHIAAHIAAQSDHPIAALDGARMAYNETLSQSGWAAPWQHFKQASVRIGPRLQSGSHRKSAQMVARGDADFAALDVVSWKLMQRHDAFASALMAVAQTAPTPALPFISAAYRDVSPIFFALEKAIAALSPSEQAELMLKGLVNIAQSSYDAVPNPPSP